MPHDTRPFLIAGNYCCAHCGRALANVGKKSTLPVDTLSLTCRNENCVDEGEVWVVRLPRAEVVSGPYLTGD
ncbi:ogr/delta-like zinc finger [Bacteriophage sp.]|nr:ogr/delta-like zinc finger [Bacteriophage sp.]